MRRDKKRNQPPRGSSPGGRFHPSIANGRCFGEWTYSIYLDELASYARRYAQEHPV